ncbi:MAG: hypothetical protein H7A24_04070 [Leptospiraceae bacterium]|nr:hypothetical protein [Leptospiraceae bacterium]MCP5511030.1 hypothetical protein [Leptospiraceae bacterium]
MLSASIQNKVSLSKLVQTNKRISTVKNLAFQIKIKSLNEQILSIKNNMDETGFQVVSREFILFSKVFEELANEMQVLMDSMLPNIAEKIKSEKLGNLKRLTETYSQTKIFSSNKKSQKENEENQDRWQKSLSENSRSLVRLLKRSELLSLQGNIIFMQSKITGAYIRETEQGSLLLSLTNELGEIMTEVRNNVTYIKKIWED